MYIFKETWFQKMSWNNQHSFQVLLQNLESGIQFAELSFVEAYGYFFIFHFRFILGS